MEKPTNNYRQTKINKVNQGTLFKLRKSDTSTVWVRGEFIRFEGKYSCHKYEDSNHEKLMGGSQIIFTNFTY